MGHSYFCKHSLRLAIISKLAYFAVANVTHYKFNAQLGIENYLSLL